MKARTAKKRPPKARRITCTVHNKACTVRLFVPPTGTQGVREIAPPERVHVKCEICRAEMKPGRHGPRKCFCSTKCRRLACSIRQIEAALEAGEAEGARPLIENLIYKPGPRGSGILNRRLHNAEEKRDVSN